MNEIVFPPNNGGKLPGLSKNWLTVKLTLYALSLNKANVVKVYENAFDTPQFVSMRMLMVSNTPISELCTGAFNGLNNLQKITFSNVKLYQFEAKILAPTPNLMSFFMKNCGKKQLNVDNLFGSVPMHRLEEITIQNCNLNDSITEKTFSNLYKIDRLKLGSNKITTIAPNAFDVPLQSLRTLNLKNNQLKSLPMHLFAKNVMSKIVINLNENPWHCDCKLDDLRQFLQLKNDLKFGKIICQSPSEFAGQKLEHCPSLCNTNSPLDENNLLGIPIEGTRVAEKVDGKTGNEEDEEDEDEDENEDEVEEEEVEEEEEQAGGDRKEEEESKDEYWEKEVENEDENEFDNESQADSEEYENDNDVGYETEEDGFQNDVETAFDDHIVEQDYEFEGDDWDDDAHGYEYTHDRYIIVQCERPTLYVQLLKPAIDLLSFRVENHNFYISSENLTQNNSIIGFVQQSDTTNDCLGNFEGVNEEVEIEYELKPSKMYRFCRITRNDGFVNVLDCILYQSEEMEVDLDVWLWVENKSAIIIVCVILAALVTFMGVLIAIVLAFLFPKQIRGRKIAIERPSRAYSGQQQQPQRRQQWQQKQSAYQIIKRLK